MRAYLTICVLATVVALTGCAADEAEAPVELARQGSGLTEGPISVLGSGHWRTMQGCSAWCVWNERVWIDLKVRNDAYNKDVGILWTSNGWSTVNEAKAKYEGQLGGGFERWGIDLDLGTFSDPNPPPDELEYAAYAVMGGATHWDQDNNHYIYNGVGPDRPARLLGSKAHYEEGVGAVVEGTVRVFDIAYHKKVIVRYSTDDWASHDETAAQWSNGDDWSFRIEGLGLDALPPHVDFGIRYEVGGKVYWENKDGENFRHKLQPVLNTNPHPWYVPTYDESIPLAGLLRFMARAETEIPAEGFEHRVDGGPWQESLSASLSTWELEDGEHTVEFRVTLEGGYQTSGSRSFVVENRLEPLGRWEPTFEEATEGDLRGSAWGASLGPDGSIFLQWEESTSYPQAPYRGITRFDEYGTSALPLAFDELAPPAGSSYAPSFWDITADDEGRAFALECDGGKGLYRWTAEGALDAAFGNAGRLDLEAATAAQPYDYGLDILFGDGSLWFVARCWSSTCKSGVHRLSPDGEPTGFAATADGPTFHDGESLWLLHKAALTRVAATADGIEVAEIVPLSGADIKNPEGLARTSSGLFFALDSTLERLVVFDESGAAKAHWYGGSDWPDKLGGIDLGKDILALPDGSVAVLDVEGAGMVRFAGKLK